MLINHMTCLYVNKMITTIKNIKTHINLIIIIFLPIFLIKIIISNNTNNTLLYS